MAFKMGYVCSCGEHWDTSDWAGAEAHIEANPTHVVTEGYFHSSATGVPNELPIRAAGGDVYRVQADNAGGVASDGTLGQATKLPKSRQSMTTDPGSDDDIVEGYELGSRWINSVTGVEYVCMDNTASAAVWKETTGVISTPTWAERTSILQTTCTTWIRAMRVTTVVLPAGVYRVGWCAVGRNSSTFGDWRIRVQVDDSVNIIDPGNLGFAGVETKDSGSDQRVPFAGFRYINLTEGVHTIDMDLSQKGSGTATLYFGVIEIRGI